MGGGNTQRTQVGQLRRIVRRSRWGGEAAGPRKCRVRRILPRVSTGRVVIGMGVAVGSWFGLSSMFGGEVVVW